MKKRIFSPLFFWSFCVFLFFSCSEDPDINEEEIDIADPSNVASLTSDILKDWTDLMLDLEQYTYGMRPNGSARALAYINLAVYEVLVPGMESHASMDEQLRGLSMDDSEFSSATNFEIALNTAYAEVLEHFLSGLESTRLASIESFEQQKLADLGVNQSEAVLQASQNWGSYVAQRIISYSNSDDDALEQLANPQPRSYEPPIGDGFWTYSADPERALFPYWESVRTFAVDIDETSTVEPIDYSENPGSEYFLQMQEVYEVNNRAREEQGEELWIAEFWSDDVEGLMISPPARQFAIANQLIEQYSMNLDEAAELYLRLGFSLNDAAVATWHYKYEHMVMRPNVFIHEFIDPEFQTNLFRLVFWPNPSFPGYPSGHSCFASAAAGIFIDAFGDATDFTDRTHQGRTEFLGEPRRFSTFSDMAEENAFSRIPLGVHIRMDCEEGLRLGYEIAEGVLQMDLSEN